MSEQSSNKISFRPDLNESINVTNAHHNVVVTNAAVREKRNLGSNKESISILTFLICAIGLIIGGSVIGNVKGTFFSYTTNIQPDYQRNKPPGASNEVILPPKSILDMYVKKGEKVYSKCMGCHGADGKGGAAYPSLAGSAWAKGTTERFSLIVMNGLQGPVSNGKNYGIMPAQGGGLSAQDLAYVMTYVRNSFGNTVGDVISPEMAQAAMDISAARSVPGSSVSAEELKSHDKNLTGVVIDPKILVDPITLKPVAAKK
jgi:mono/diheme cytochrome c family protein